MKVGRYKGTPEPVEHAEIKWVKLDALESVALAPADVPLAKRLAVRGSI